MLSIVRGGFLTLIGLQTGQKNMHLINKISKALFRTFFKVKFSASAILVYGACYVCKGFVKGSIDQDPVHGISTMRCFFSFSDRVLPLVCSLASSS